MIRTFDGSVGLHSGRPSERDGIDEDERANAALEREELPHATADVVPDRRKLGDVEVLQKFPHVPRLGSDVEPLDWGLLGVSVADEVGGDGPEPRGEQRHEFAPQMRGRWKAMEQNDRGAGPFVDIRHLAGRETGPLALESCRHARRMASTTRTTRAISLTS
jgi:hypothetical protein